MIPLPVRPVSGFRLSLPVRVVTYRVGQFMAALASSRDPQVDKRLDDLLTNERQRVLLQRLSAFDRRHHLDVYTRLRSTGCDDDDILMAALLHDVGKADERGRVRLGHRVVRVLLAKSTPSVLHRLCVADLPGPMHGLFLAHHHARLGADLARSTGVSERCAWLIERHEDRETAQRDTELAMLMRADGGSPW
jgi:putative nucleotidyltransferase with HDIG domain